MRKGTSLFVSTLGAALAFLRPAAFAQGRGGSDWTTAGNDAQRSSWLRADPKISRDSMQKPGFALLWKIKFENESRQSNGLMQAVLLDRYIGHRGFRSLAFIGGSSDNVFAVDTDLGRIEWQNHYPVAKGGTASSAACPGGITTALTRSTPLAISAMPGGGGGGFGRGGPAKSGVGQAGEGAVTLSEPPQGRGGRGGFPDAPPGGRGPAPAARGGGGGFGRMPSLTYAITSDGMLQSLYVSNGADSEPPAKFLPPNANAQGFIVADNVAYASTLNGCGGAPNGVWALDLESKKVANWDAGASSPVAGANPAFGPDGTLYVTTAGGQASLAALEAKTLKQKDSYAAGADFSSAPVVFDYKGKTLVAAGAKDGAIHLLDGGSLKSALAKLAGKDGAVTGLATWQDGGTRWIVAATARTVDAWKVVDRSGAPSLEPGWSSREMASPQTPTIVNGVVFALAGGNASNHAVLYALDGGSGKEYWNSGAAIGSFVHNGGLSGGGSQLYLGTHDGTLWAFGFPIEH